MPLFPALRLDRARAEATRVLALRDSEREVTGTSHGSAHHHPLRPRRQPPSGLVALDVHPLHERALRSVALPLEVAADPDFRRDPLVELRRLRFAGASTGTRHGTARERDPPDAPGPARARRAVPRAGQRRAL